MLHRREAFILLRWESTLSYFVEEICYSCDGLARTNSATKDRTVTQLLKSFTLMWMQLYQRDSTLHSSGCFLQVRM